MSSILVYWCIGAGVFLRLVDLGFHDFVTDETQAALGATAAWTPLGMQLFSFTQSLFGHTAIVARSVSAAFGILFLPLLYLLAREYCDKKTSLLAVAVAALFPSHILFSRFAYLSTQLLVGWTLTLLCFLKAKKTRDPKWLYGLFFASFYVSMVKTQGLMLPILLAFGTQIETWRVTRKLSLVPSPLSLVLILSLLPVTLYILTHPGIPATILHYEGNLYGTSHFLTRITDLLSTWWHILSLFLLLLLASLSSLRKFSWPLWVTLGWFVLHGLLLGPGNPYYATELTLFALPIAFLITCLPRLSHFPIILTLLATTLMLLGPRTYFLSRFTLNPFREEGYWNAHAPAINTLLKDERSVTILGKPGHDVRWYLEPRIILGDSMTPPYPTPFVLVPYGEVPDALKGELVYDDGRIQLYRQE
jgi:4-amino-4-deoxy-L-arabinose transferase-like glycosyltransferase